MRSRSALLRGSVMHQRLGALSHGFRYPVYMIRVALDAPGGPDAHPRLLGLNRAGLVSFHESDHLDARPGSLRDRVVDLLREHGVTTAIGEIDLVTNPRVFGYVFNPVSFFLCRTTAGAPAATICEVNNTFGERHVYVLPAEAAQPAPPGGPAVWQAKKVLHVSPFYTLDGTYRFQFDITTRHLDVRIDLLRGGNPVFVTRLALDAEPLTDGAIARAFTQYPFMTLKVIGAIHWEALKLWLKGATYHPKPAYDPAAARRTET